MFVSVVQQLQFRLLFKEAEKQLVIMQGSGKTNHTRLIGTISLKLSSSFRRSLTYGGRCVISLGSSSISMPFFFNVEREGTIFLLEAVVNEDVSEGGLHSYHIRAAASDRYIIRSIYHKVLKAATQD